MLNKSINISILLLIIVESSTSEIIEDNITREPIKETELNRRIIRLIEIKESNEDLPNRYKRSLPENDKEPPETKENTTEECVGAAEFCNMTKEAYIAMLQEYIYPQTYEWVLIATHSIVFLTGLIGNALVCIAVYRNHSMRTVTNYFIVNLAVADFMVILFCLPATVLWDVTETWFLGDVLCKMLLYFQSVSVTVSVLTLTFISVDRWYAICFPLKFKSTTSRAKTAILIIWILSLSFNSPDLVVLKTDKPVPLRFELEYLVQCIATWSSQADLVWHILKVVFIYTKAAKMLVAVVVMFAVCYFPVHLLSVLRYTLDMEQSDAITFLALVSHVMCYANSAVNPLIYNFMSGKFRREFRRAFCCSTRPVHENFTSLTRVTTSKKKEQSCDKGLSQRNVSNTTFIQNGFKSGYYA
ncbi:hypothetical protein O3G_MSEX011786 [Manduca sexta]|uniref:G-protein coupled receptors family 1 profile domain-containing protein n=1 Tax=Manduca sexta TaxID=7130 RepID=A0A921ZM20_MANSE|nr:hypothetical protein O3G_MSEX011786 [Manduca sexta]